MSWKDLKIGKKSYIDFGIVLVMALSVSLVLALSASVFAIEIPKGKTAEDFVNEAKAHVQGISPEETKKLMDGTDNVVLLDIRSFAEFKEHGWIPGRTVLPHGMVIFNITKIVPNNDVPIIVYCKKGKRSTLVAYQLKQMGYEDVRWLDGGILAWIRKGLPVEKSGDSKVAEAPVVPEGKMPAGKSADDFVAEANRVVKAVSPSDAKQMMDAKDAVLLDIRSAQEIESLGAIDGALVMEHGKVVFNIKKKVHDANKPLLVFCKKGKRSALIAQQLQEMGYKDVHCIKGGFIAWKEAGLVAY
jgi:rhodanese-related sulfurtransferase